MSTFTTANFHSEPALTIIEVNDQNAKEVGIELFEQDVVKLSQTPLRARRIILRLASTVLVYHSANIRVRTRTNIGAESMVYAAFGPDAAGAVNGLPIRPGVILAAAPESEARFVVDSDWESVSIFLPKQEIMAHMAIRQPGSQSKHFEGLQLLEVNPDAAQQLFALGKTVIQTAEAQPELFHAGSNEQRAVQIDLIEALLATLLSSNPLPLSQEERTKQKQFAIVNAAEQHALIHADVDLYVTDLCQAAGVSERTLEYAFKEITGLTPTAYIKQLRLHRVYQSLLHAAPGTTTVSKEAQRWGFWHFSELSKTYKKCFHELPSETLLRAPQEKIKSSS